MSEYNIKFAALFILTVTNCRQHKILGPIGPIQIFSRISTARDMCSRLKFYVLRQYQVCRIVLTYSHIWPTTRQIHNAGLEEAGVMILHFVVPPLDGELVLHELDVDVAVAVLLGLDGKIQSSPGQVLGNRMNAKNACQGHPN